MKNKCFCEKPDIGILSIAGDDEYAEMFVDTADETVDNHMTLFACGGDGTATFAPKFCPFCGRKIRDKSLFQHGFEEDSLNPAISDKLYYERKED